MSNSSLVRYTNLTKKFNARNQKISKITIHHNAGIASAKNITDFFNTTSRDVSSNYVIGGDGLIALSVEEHNRAWTSSSEWNDQRAVTIEVANDTVAPTWSISDEAMKSLINLCIDICKRNGIGKLYFDGTKNGSLTLHRFYSNTNCPGAYIESKLQYIQDTVNSALNGSGGSNNGGDSNTSGNAKSYVRPEGTKKEINGGGRFVNTCGVNIHMRQYVPDVNAVFNGKLAPNDYVDYQDVWVGNGHVWVGNGTTWIPTRELDSNGKPKPISEAWGRYDGIPSNTVNKKTAKQIANDIVNGKNIWGNMPERKTKLEQAGYNYEEVRKEINKLV